MLMNRPRRNRKNEVIRSMVRESHLLPAHLIAPLFVVEGSAHRIEIKSMPGHFRLSIDELVKEALDLAKGKVTEAARLGFPVVLKATDEAKQRAAAGAALGALADNAQVPMCHPCRKRGPSRNDGDG